MVVKKKRHSNPTLIALTTSALALPGMSANASELPDTASAKYRYTYYLEDEAPERYTIEGDIERYEIRAQQLQLIQPIGERSVFTFDYLTETMSGASPWGIQQGADDQPELIMSGASIEENRQDVTTSLRIYDQESSIAFAGGYSRENDYKAVYGGLDNELHFNQKNTTMNLGLGFSQDSINPTQQEGLDRVRDEEKSSSSYYLGIAQVLNQSTMIRASLGFTQLSGFLTDPYKLQDSRPDVRKQTTLTFGYRQFIARTESALHLDFRYYTDDWKLESHTLDIAWQQNLGEGQLIVPSIRWYTQQQAEFYGLYFDENSGTKYFSNDYRLSTYDALSYKLKYTKYFDTWSFTIAGERYESKASKASGSSIEFENPGLVSFTRWTVGFDIKF
jgi:hypothetical protein